MEVLIRGIYEQCTDCRAGIPIGKWPEGWPVTVSRGRLGPDSPVQPVTFTPHSSDNCTKPRG